jgi:hypothetical protein
MGTLRVKEHEIQVATTSDGRIFLTIHWVDWWLPAGESPGAWYIAELIKGQVTLVFPCYGTNGREVAQGWLAKGGDAIAAHIAQKARTNSELKHDRRPQGIEGGGGLGKAHRRESHGRAEPAKPKADAMPTGRGEDLAAVANEAAASSEDDDAEDDKPAFSENPENDERAEGLF